MLDQIIVIVVAGLVHAMIVCGFGVAIVQLHHAVAAPKSARQRRLRWIAFSTGLLVFLGGRPFGLSLGGVMGSSLETGIASFVLLGLLVPAMLGWSLGWYINYEARRSREIGIRVLILVCTFIVVEFGDVYLTGVAAGRLSRTRQFTPNLVFAAALGLYLILHEIPEPRTP